jgi:alpha-mannosidase/mannosylglycerate hydrolase
MTRIAHYVRSTHWDREWYEPFQGYRMRLVSMLDEVLDTLGKDAEFKFNMDGQAIPVIDFLEIRPEKAQTLQRYVMEGRFKAGPWYVAPDEWLVCGESIVRNLEMGIETAAQWGAPASRAGFVCDQFGHIGQLPQIFDQFAIAAAFIWRGTTERDHHGHFLWQSPDGTVLPAYRFGPSGYCTLAYRVRDVLAPNKPLDVREAVSRLVDYTRFEAARSNLSPILLFDGGDHLEIEPRMSEIIAWANERLAAEGIHIVASDLDSYQAAMARERSHIKRTLIGELRETGREPQALDEVWLIPGCYSSRIHLKQRNAACEDELCLWAEPFCTFASEALSREYPSSYLRLAWKHLLENHPHDSMCGCSIDQVHQDMIYRFDQSIGISARLTEQALRAITAAAAPKLDAAGSLVVGVFNATAEPIDEPVDLEIPLPTNWPTKFKEFFGFEEKFSFKIRGPGGEEIPYQLVHQRRDSNGFHVTRYKFPTAETRHVVSVTARLAVPPFGYVTLVVEPSEGPTRYAGSMATSHRTIENEFLQVAVNPNGTLALLDKRAGHAFDQLLTFEQRADIGDGWFHGVAVNDAIFNSSACCADVALIADGIDKATLRIDLTMNVPESFDFRAMARDARKAPLQIVSEVTLRRGIDRVEVKTTVHNTVLDHRLRVLFPTGLAGDSYWCDGAFDCLERPVALAADNAIHKELDIETRPQMTWTAFGDGRAGLAVVSRGLPESAVVNRPDRPIALTLLRAFRKAVFSDDNPGGQIQGDHLFRYDLIPFAGPVPVKKLFLLGQRVNAAVRQVTLHPADLASAPASRLPRSHAFGRVEGDVVVTSVRRHERGRRMRLFNPQSRPATVKLGPVKSVQSETLDGRDDAQTKIERHGNGFEAVIGAKTIATLVISAR